MVKKDTCLQKLSHDSRKTITKQNVLRVMFKHWTFDFFTSHVPTFNTTLLFMYALTLKLKKNKVWKHTAFGQLLRWPEGRSNWPGGGNFLEKIFLFFFSQIFFGWSLGWVELIPASSWPQKMLFSARFLRQILKNTQKKCSFLPLFKRI